MGGGIGIESLDDSKLSNFLINRAPLNYAGGLRPRQVENLQDCSLQRVFLPKRTQLKVPLSSECHIMKC